MVDPEARQVSGEPPRSVQPIMAGSINGRDFVVSLATNAGAVYVQFEGWVVEYPVQALLEEAFAEVWGEQSFDIDLNGGNEDGN